MKHTSTGEPALRTRGSPTWSRTRLGVLVTAVWIAAVLGVLIVADLPLLDEVAIPWWLLTILIYVGERFVVHSRSKRQIRTFSLNEIPVVLGFFFAEPAHLLSALAVANLIVLFAHRGQRGLRLAFNLGQFTLVNAIAIGLFRVLVAFGQPVGPAGWLGAFAATTVATLVAATLIGMAMRITGARVDRRDERRMLGISLVGAAVNTALALAAVTIMWFEPTAVWLSLVPAAIVFVGYRSYVIQQEERAQLGMLYEASLSLHRSRNIEYAVLAAAEQVRTMVDAAVGAVILFADGPDGVAYLTDIGSEDSAIIMRAVSGPAMPVEWAPVLTGASVVHTTPTMRPGTGRGEVENGIAVPLVSADRRILGVLIAADRLGGVDAFGRHHQELLETLASVLTVVLEKERLEDSLTTITGLKEQLEEAAKSKDQFIASISHELRTPLTAVVGLSEELTRNSDEYAKDDLDEFHHLIAQQSSELSYIVEDLLVAARADSGSIPLHPQVIDVAQTVTAVVDGQKMLGQSDVDVVVAAAGLESYADPLRVRQVVRNLLTNAARYGGPDVEVWVGEDGGGAPIVVVSDDGAGVPAGEERTIFEAYKRASEGRSAPGSVGLGLAVSRQLARGMGGDLVYRRRGDRTEFVLQLPTAATVDIGS